LSLFKWGLLTELGIGFPGSYGAEGKGLDWIPLKLLNIEIYGSSIQKPQTFLMKITNGRIHR
jgi:hypothetical protein